MKVGCLFQLGGLWIGAHYSKENKRWCINLFPCCTVWIVRKGGNTPYTATKKKNKKEKNKNAMLLLRQSFNSATSH